MDRIANVRNEAAKPQSAELGQENLEGQSLLGPESENAMQLQAAADECPNVRQLKGFQEAANNSAQVKQLRRLQDAANGSAQVGQLKAQQHAVQLKSASLHASVAEMDNQKPQKPALQLKGIELGQNANASSKAPMQLKVMKRKAGEWYSTYDPFKFHATKKAATKYDQECKSKGMEETKERVPTIYTYTHTKPHCKLSSVPQGPHTVAHKVTWDSLVQLTTLAEVQQLFDDQVLTPDDASEIVFQDESPASGFSGQMDARLQRWAADYAAFHQAAEVLFKDPTANLVRAKDLVNKLLQMDPYATYAWKTTQAASKASLKGKGESKPDATFQDLVDQPPKASVKNQDAMDSFMAAREQMFEDSRMHCDDDDA